MTSWRCARRHRPRIAPRQPRQIGNQLDRFVRQLAGNAHSPDQFQIHRVQERREQFAQLRVIDAGLNQLDQQPLVLLLPHGQPAVAQ